MEGVELNYQISFNGGAPDVSFSYLSDDTNERCSEPVHEYNFGGMFQLYALGLERDAVMVMTIEKNLNYLCEQHFEENESALQEFIWQKFVPNKGDQPKLDNWYDKYF